MKINPIYLVVFLLFLSIHSAQGQIEQDPILKAIKSEIDRNKAGLHAGNLDIPFWISYRLLCSSRTNIVASEGNILSNETQQNNTGTTDLLVGNYASNNNNYQSYSPRNRSKVGETDLESAVKYDIWNQLDPVYKKAAEAFERKKVQIVQQNIPQEELSIPDWDQSTPTQYYQKQTPQSIDLSFWTDYCQKASLAISTDSAILTSEFRVEIIQGDYYYYSTDNFMYRMPVRFMKLIGTVECRSEEGQKMTEQYCYYFDDLNDVIPIKDLCTEIIGFNHMLIEESRAPQLSDSYSGPVLYEGTAVSDAITDNFINNSNGLLAKRKEISQSNNSGNTENRMEQMMNKKVADPRLNFSSMTGTPRWNGQKIAGFTPIDAEGVKPDSSLVLIENGLLRNLLSDRTPTKTNPKSNGHSRPNLFSAEAELGVGVLRVRSTKTIPREALKDSLLAAAKEEGYDFAYLWRGYKHMSGCFLYKVFQDGREKMVRNGSINDLNQKQFKYILHIGAEENLYNTMTGESIVSLIVPCGIIFKELEIVRNTNVSLNKPFIVPRPKIK